MEFVKRIIMARKQIGIAELSICQWMESVNVGIVHMKSITEDVAMHLTQVMGWPVKNNVITNRKNNKKKTKTKVEKNNNNEQFLFGYQVPDDRKLWKRYWSDSEKIGES